PTDRAARDPGEAGVCPPTAHAGLRRPVRGRIPLPRPRHRLLSEREPAHGTAPVVGTDPRGARGIPSPGGRHHELGPLLGSRRRRELPRRVPPLVLHPFARPDPRRAARRGRRGDAPRARAPGDARWPPPASAGGTTPASCAPPVGRSV